MKNSMKAFNRMVAAGKMPVVGVVMRNEYGCWIDTTSGWSTRPVIIPDEKDALECGCCLWPLTETVAVYLSVNRGRREVENIYGTDAGDADKYPCPEGVICGFSEYPADGRKFAVLLERSVDAVSAGLIINH